MPASSKMDTLLAKVYPISNRGSTSLITYLRRKKTTVKLQLKRGVRIWERNNSTDTNISEEGGGGGVPGTRAEIPLQPVRVNGGADIHLQPVEDPTLEQFRKNCSLWEGLTLKKFVEDCLLWEGPHAGAGEECEESSP
ncbi:protein pxr1-like [Limosa lapponica baueri]|uniref:Protein pxr1-like n=1 Tax=Limosa lapponica baueri TaxID=1758121 RepID=A0A2I0U924_LIMLA|nr:protein pxr1-like [Limosa lapponica baueri]